MTVSTDLVPTHTGWDEIPALDSIPALTVRQPWVTALLRRIKPVENRTWVPFGPAAAHGWMWLHEAGQAAGKSGRRFVTDRGHPELAEMPCQPGIVAAIRFGVVCGLTVAGLSTPPGACDCGPWAFPGEFHWPVADLVPLDRRVVCSGAVKQWYPGPAVLDQIRTQIGVPA